MYQIKNKTLYLIFLLLFPFAVYSTSDCKVAFHSKARSGTSNWLSHSELSKAVIDSSEINSSKEYQLQYKDKTFNSIARSGWLSSEQLVDFVKTSEEMNDSRVYRLRYRPSEPGLVRRTAQAGVTAAKTTFETAKQINTEVRDTFENARQESLKQVVRDANNQSNKAEDSQANPEATENASTATGNENSNSFMENLKFTGKVTAATAAGLGAAGGTALANKAKQLSSDRAAARAERVQAKQQEREQTATAKQQEREQTATAKQQEREQTATAKQQEREQTAAARASRYQTARQVFQNPEAVGRAALSTVTRVLPDNVVAAGENLVAVGKNVVSKVKRTKNENTETETQQQATEEVLNQKISDVLNLGPRIERALSAANVVSLRNLMDMTRADLLNTKDIAEKSVEKIEEQLAENGWTLKKPADTVAPEAQETKATETEATAQQESVQPEPASETRNEERSRTYWSGIGVRNGNANPWSGARETLVNTVAQRAKQLTSTETVSQLWNSFFRFRNSFFGIRRNQQNNTEPALLEHKQEAAETETAPATKAAETETAPATKAAETETAPATKAAETETAPATKAADAETAPAQKSGETETAPATKAAETETAPATKAEAQDTPSAEKPVEQAKTPQAQEAQSTETAPNILNQKVRDVLNLRTRTIQSLEVNANIIYMEDLVKMSEADLFKLPDIGKKSIQDIKEQLAEKGSALSPLNTDTASTQTGTMDRM